MAISDQLGDVGALVAKFGNALVLVLITLIICGVTIGIVFLIMRSKQFKKYKVLIFKRKKDSKGNETLVFCGIDKGAVWFDKKLKKRYFRLKENNICLGEEERVDFDENRELNVPSLPSEKGGELVFIEKLGPRKFAVGNPMLFDGTPKIIIAEADCAEAIRQYDLNAKYYGGKEWTKWIGPISFAVFAVLIVILISVVLNKFEVLSDVSDKLVRAAEVLSSGKSSAIPSGVQ